MSELFKAAGVFKAAGISLGLGLAPLPIAADSGGSDSGDSGGSDSGGDSGETADTGPDEVGYTLADRTKDEGGCGFGGSAAALLPGVLALGYTLSERRR